MNTIVYEETMTGRPHDISVQKAASDNEMWMQFNVMPRTPLVTSLVLSRLDNGNAILAGIPQHIRRLQSVMNATARLNYSLSRFEHITPLLRQLHWLKVKD